MNPREKRLLILLLAALFVVANALAVRWIGQKRDDFRNAAAAATTTIEGAAFAEQQRQTVEDEVAWLEENQPQPKEGELVPSELERLATSAAQRWSLSVVQPEILDSVGGEFFERARLQIKVSGAEASLYRWLVEMHNPEQFRAVREMQLSPNREDDTQIDATILIEQYYVPKDAALPPETASLETP